DLLAFQQEPAPVGRRGFHRARDPEALAEPAQTQQAGRNRPRLGLPAAQAEARRRRRVGGRPHRAGRGHRRARAGARAAGVGSSDYPPALPRLAEISSIAARSASLTLWPPSLWAFATLSASVSTKPL